MKFDFKSGWIIFKKKGSDVKTLIIQRGNKLPVHLLSNNTTFKGIEGNSAIFEFY